MDRKTVIFVTQTLGYKAACGIGIIGDLIGKTLLKSTNYDFKLVYSDSLEELDAAIIKHSPSAVIYNYASGSTPWVDKTWLREKYSKIPHIKIYHDMHQGLIDIFSPGSVSGPPTGHFGFNYLISDDPTLIGTDNVFITQRLMPPCNIEDSSEPIIPTIGFQGFGAPHKGLLLLTRTVQNEFDNAIIRMHMPACYYGDLHGFDTSGQKRVEECRNIITKPGIKIEATYDFLTLAEIVQFLSENTINCYFYDALLGAGLASSPDAALAAKKPIAVTKSFQLRNFLNLSPSVCIEDRSLKEIIASGVKPLQPLHEAYTEENVIYDYETILGKLI